MPPGRLSNWIINSSSEKKIPEKTQQALARLEGCASRTSYKEAFKHHGPLPPRSRSASDLKLTAMEAKGKASGKQRKHDYATTYSDAFLHHGRESYEKPQAVEKLKPTLTPEQLRQEQRKADRQAKYWATIFKARSMEEQNKDGTYMMKDLGPLQGNLPDLAKVLLGEGEAKATFATGAKSNLWKSEAKANYNVEVFSASNAEKYELPTQLVSLARSKNM